MFDKVLIIESRSDIRGLLRDILKEQGIANPISVYVVEEALVQLRDNVPNWIITSLDVQEDKNTFYLLSHLLEDEKFHKTMVSVLLSQEERHFIPLLMEFGVLSIHMKPTNQKTLGNELRNITTTVSDDVLTQVECAARFLREYLSADEASYDDLIRMESKLAKLYPNNGPQLLKLAEAYLLAGKEKEAKVILTQAKFHHQDLNIGIKQLEDLVPDQDETQLASFYGFEKIVIVDPDESSRFLINDALTEIGIKEVISFEDGKEALKFILESPPDLVIIEWKMRSLAGHQFLNMVREKLPSYLHIMVCSSQLNGKDEALLREIGVVGLIRKPTAKKYMITQILAIMRDCSLNVGYKDYERRLLHAFSQSDVGKVREIFESADSKDNISKSGKKILKAHLCYLMEEFNEAKQLCLDAYKESGEALIVLNLLGKVFMKLGDHASAVKCLSKAQESSSENIERLCNLASSLAANGDGDLAIKSIEEAKKIDTNSTKVIEAEITVEISVGHEENAKKIMKNVENIEAIISQMNNRAILLAQQGKSSEAMSLYDKTIASMPDEKRYEKNIVIFNKTLALVRMGDMAKAKETITNIEKKVDAAFDERVEKIQRTLDAAIKQGKVISIDKSIASKKTVKNRLMLTSLSGQRGSLRLHLVYDSGLVNSDAYKDYFSYATQDGGAKTKKEDKKSA